MQPTKAAFLVSMGAVLVGPASAATATTSFNVGAYVLASCTIPSRLSADPRAALAAKETMCRGTTGGIVAARPQIRVEHDAAAGITRVVFAF